MQTIIDTCVWIEHFRAGVPELVALLKERRALTHSCVIGELACGAMPDRFQTIEDLLLLPKAVESTPSETLKFIQSHKLYARGLGWVDCQLLASAKLSGARLFTFDKKLARFS